VFQIPPHFYQAVIKSIYFNDTRKTVEMEELALNRNDYEWMKDLRQRIGQGKQITFQLFNGDLISLHKGLLNVFRNEFEDDDISEENEYAFLSDKAEFDPTNVDFTDKGALLKRQREILKQIEVHQFKKMKMSTNPLDMNTDSTSGDSKFGYFNPFATLSTGLKLWFIILCEGGSFCIAKIEKDKIVDHKSDSKYVQRKKAGKRQMNFDKKSSCMTSVGSQMRRNNERLHQQHIQETIEEYIEDLNKADMIFLNAPGMNKLFFVGPDKPLRDMRYKIKTLSFNMKKANFTELQRAFEEVIEMKMVFNMA